MVAECYHSAMAKDLHVRGVPDDVHRVLVARAAAKGMSLRRYVIELLSEHASKPTMSEWLAEVAKLERTGMNIDVAEVLREDREEREEELANRVRRSR